MPSGFRAYAARAGLYAEPKRLDVAFFVSDAPCSAAGLFTTNVVRAAPVLLSEARVKSGRAQAIVANSGCANACTGPRGMKDARAFGERAAKAFGLDPESVLVASTGVIGKFLPVSKLGDALDSMSQQGGAGREGSEILRAAKAIMTTDTVPKIAASQLSIGGRKVTIWGCAKGAGMIHPNMATMLSFIFTDADVEARVLKSMLKRAADQSYNALSVDGDTSTNDTVLLLANGLSGAKVRGAAQLKAFETELCKVTRSLAEQIAADGEGATSRVDVTVKGARNDADAKKIALTVATSPLVKTAVFGRDANWGRVLAAAGRSGAQFDPSKAEVLFDKLCVAKQGCARAFSEAKAKKILSQKIVPITVDLHQGAGKAQYVTCDFSLDYVKINADYRT